MSGLGQNAKYSLRAILPTADIRWDISKRHRFALRMLEVSGIARHRARGGLDLSPAADDGGDERLRDLGGHFGAEYRRDLGL